MLCQIETFILLSGGNKINLCYKTVITKAVCVLSASVVVQCVSCALKGLHLKDFPTLQFVPHHKSFNHVKMYLWGRKAIKIVAIRQKVRCNEDQYHFEVPFLQVKLPSAKVENHFPT